MNSRWGLLALGLCLVMGGLLLGQFLLSPREPELAPAAAPEPSTLHEVSPPEAERNRREWEVSSLREEIRKIREAVEALAANREEPILPRDPRVEKIVESIDRLARNANAIGETALAAEEELPLTPVGIAILEYPKPVRFTSSCAAPEPPLRVEAKGRLPLLGEFETEGWRK